MSANQGAVYFVVSTAFHLMYALICGSYSKDKRNNVLIINNSDSQLLLWASSTDVFSLIEVIKQTPDVNGVKDFIRFMKQKNITHKNVRKLFEKNNPGDVVLFKDTDVLTRYMIDNKTKYNYHVSMIQDGLAIYRQNPKLTFRSLGRAILKVTIGMPNPWGLSQGSSRKVNSIAVSDPACLPESKCKGKKILQLPLKAPDRALLTVLMSKFPDFDSSSGSEDIRCGSKYVILYLGQPLSEYKIINKRDEIALIQRAVNCVSGDEVIVYIKLHPREDVEKYSSLKGSVKYITSGIPAELVMSFLQPHLVISAWSSAGVVVEKWFNKKVIYLIKLIQNCNKLPNSEDALFDNAPITWAEFERTVQLCVVEKDVHATKVIDSDARNTYALFTDSLLNS